MPDANHGPPYTLTNQLLSYSFILFIFLPLPEVHSFCYSYFPPSKDVDSTIEYISFKVILWNLSFLFVFFNKWPLFRLFLVVSNKQYNFDNKSMWKMSIQYMAPGFEPMTSWTWADCKLQLPNCLSIQLLAILVLLNVS